MTPSARLQAAIDLLDEIIASARDGGPAADTLIARYFKARRYAGSKDRRAVRDLVYDAIRQCGERPQNGRAAMLALAQDQLDLAALFDGSPHGPAPIAPDEPVAATGTAPAWLIPKLADPVRKETELAALLERAPLDLRVNALRGDAATARAAFPDAIAFPELPGALRLPEGSAVERSAAYRDGLVEVQDLGSQLIVRACEARSGMTVIDLCAGAGGKTLGLAADMEGRGRLIAADVNRDRLARLPDRASRAGANFIETPLLDAGHEQRALAALAGSADVVLVDAPCSGTGTWRRNPEARWRLTPERLARVAQEQARILALAAPLVKPGGRLIYAVCALTDAEGRDQVSRFLAANTGWKRADFDAPFGRIHGDGRLLTPAHDGTDGFFIAVLVKL